VDISGQNDRAGKLAGVKPARQKRSRQRRDELFTSGMKLLCSRGLDEVSVADITTECGYSIGTFYSRFDDKESFFQALQQRAVDEVLSNIQKEFSKPHWLSAAPEDVLSTTIDFLVHAFNSDVRGVIKESIVESRGATKSWLPIKDAGKAITDVVVALLQHRFLKESPAASEDSIRFGMQMVYGTLVQSLLNNPGPVALDDPAMPANLSRMLRGFVVLDQR